MRHSPFLFADKETDHGKISVTDQDGFLQNAHNSC